MTVTPPLLGSATVTKELVAQIDQRTTMICLSANGQVRRLDEFFDTLNGAWDAPPFHFRCRSMVQFLVPGITNVDTSKSQAELRRRFADDKTKAAKQARREAKTARPDSPPLVRQPTELPAEIRASARAERLAKARHARALKAEPSFTETVSDAAKESKGRMAGLEFRLKTEASIAEKIEREVVEHLRSGIRLTYEQARDNLNDINRYTVLFKPSTYGTQQAAFRRTMADRGWQIVKDKNFWQPGPYRGHNTLWRAPDGQHVEIQFHTKQSFDLKMRSHEIFARQRIIDPGTPESVALTAEMKANADALTMPTGAMRHGNRADPAAINEFAANARAERFIAQSET